MTARKTVAAAATPAPEAKPTQLRPRDTQGRELDDDGLPLSGPARARLLAEQAELTPAATEMNHG